MKTRTKAGLWLGLVMAVIAAIIGIICIRPKSNVVFADESVGTEERDGFIVSSYEEDVAATYTFVRLNDTECSVRISNKSEATKAIVPSVGKIDGKNYKVTEVTANGFMSSAKLIRVSLPYTIKKIGNNAFANCAKLNRINLSNVEEIGNSAFMRCPELSYLVIPKSVTKIGTYILRNNNTQVRARAEEAGANWASTWNTNNTNQEVEYASAYVQPLELEPIYDTLSRSAGAITGYALAGGQPRTDEFYTVTQDNRESLSEQINGNIFIPAEINGVPIKAIGENAFDGVGFNQLIVEYSDEEMTIGGQAFIATQGNNIYINRKATFLNEETFMFSEVSSIILPDCEEFETIVPNMFAACLNLTNLFIIAPENYDLKDCGCEDCELENCELGDCSLGNRASKCLALKKIQGLLQDNAEGSNIGIIELPDGSHVKNIGDGAFDGATAITELHLDDSFESVGSSIVAGWGEDQVVYVHNHDELVGWAEDWNDGTAKIIYDYRTYTITYDLDGGTITNNVDSIQTVVYGRKINNVPTVEKTHYEFKGWYCEEYPSFDINDNYELEFDITLKANWEGVLYTIEIDLKGGVGNSNSIEVHYGDPLPDLEAPTKKGHRFLGYWGDSEGKGDQYYYPDMVHIFVCEETESCPIPSKIYACWTPNYYEVSLNPQNGDNANLIQIKYGDGMTLGISIPQRDHYEFKGYYTEPNGGGDQYYYANMTSDKTWDIDEDEPVLYAHWEAKVYTILYSIEDMRNLPEDYGNEEQNLTSYTCETVFPIQINDFDSYGYRITWEPKVISEFSENITINGSLNLLSYTIFYDGLDGATNHIDNPESYDVETYVELQNPSHPHYDFFGWELNGHKITNLNGITGDIILTATWSNIYNIYIDKSFTELNIYQPQVSIVFNVRFKSNCTINVSPETTLLGINGNGYAFNMNINILQRSTEFGLLLYDIGIQAHSTKYAINMPSSQTLHLYTYKNVIIKGCSVAVPAYSPNDLRVDGVSAISCGSLIVHSSDYLFIQGGSGYDGFTYAGNGLNGGNGAAGVRVDSQVIIACDNVTIAGGYAGDGGDSVLPSTKTGKGGKGAKAIAARKSQSIQLGVLKDATNIKLLNSPDGKNGGYTGTPPLNPEPPFYDPTIPPITAQKPPVEWGNVVVPVIEGGGQLPEPPIPPIITQ